MLVPENGVNNKLSRSSRELDYSFYRRSISKHYFTDTLYGTDDVSEESPFTFVRLRPWEKQQTACRKLIILSALQPLPECFGKEGKMASMCRQQCMPSRTFHLCPPSWCEIMWIQFGVFVCMQRGHFLWHFNPLSCPWTPAKCHCRGSQKGSCVKCSANTSLFLTYHINRM